MEEKKKDRIQFLFLIPLLLVFCGFFLPLVNMNPDTYQVFRGKELYELYWEWPEYAPPQAGYGWLVSLFRLVPILALPPLVLAIFGKRITAVLSILFAVFCLVLTLGLAFPGYEPLVGIANQQELGLPATNPGFFQLIADGYVGVGFAMVIVFSVVLLFYSLYFLATKGRGGLTRRGEQYLYDSARHNIRQYMMIIALLGIWGIFYALTERGIFLTARNLSNLFLQSASTAVIATGVVLILVTMNIDLSIGSVVGFIGAIAAVTQVDSPIAAALSSSLTWLGVPLDFMAILGVLAALIVGWLIGTWHGLWIAYLGVPAFIVTLSSMMVFRGGLLYFTGGKSIANMYPWFKYIGMEYVPIGASKIFTVAVIVAYLVFEIYRRAIRRRYGFEVSSLPTQILKMVVVSAAIGGFFAIMILYKGIPYAWLIVMVVTVILTFVAEKTTFGRHLYAIGGNPEAARLSGINIQRKIMYMYMMVGVVVAIGGIIFLSRLNSATANAGNGLELDCIASAVIGGTSLMGGEGFIYGGVVGALVMGSLDNGMQLLNFDATWQYIVKGLVLLLAVFVDIATRRKGS